MRYYLLFFLLSLSGQIWAQQIYWKYEDVFSSLNQSGRNPSFTTDTHGNTHISYWNEAHDRLIYGFLAQGTTTWSFEEVDTLHACGYISQIRINPLTGNPAVAYFENLVNECVLRYAERGANGWVIEVPDNNQTRGGYGLNALGAPGYIHASLDLRFSAGNKPYIVFFDGSYNYEPPEYYGLETWIAVKNGAQWQVNGFGNIPMFDPSITFREWKAGAKYGEYCQLLEKPDGTFAVVTAGTGNGELYLFQEINGWTKAIIDSISRSSNTPFLEETRLFETFDGLSSTIGPNGIIDITYGISELYGRNRTSWTTTYFSPKHLVMNHLRVYPDGSTRTHAITPRDSVYRAYTTVKSKGLDSLFMTYAEPANRRIRFAWSVDSGATWQHSTLITMQDPTQKVRMDIVKDTLVAFFYHTEMKILMNAKLPLSSLSSNAWTFSQVTKTQNITDYIASQTQIIGSDTLIHVSFSDVLEKKLYYAQRKLGQWSVECIDSNRVMIDINIQLDKNANVCIAYTDQTQGVTRLKRQSGSFWTNEVITSGAFSFLQFKVVSDTFHCAYFDNASQALFYLRKIGSGIWLPELVCTNAGEFPSLIIGYGNLPHISYYDRVNGCLVYTYKNPSTPTVWTIDTVAKIPNQDIGQWNDLMLIKNQPSIVYRNTTYNTLMFSEKVNNQWKQETIQDDGIGLVGFPAKLRSDSSAIPYVLFNELNTVSQFFILRRVSPNMPWIGLPINNNDGLLSDIFDMNIIGKSIHIIGRKNAYKDEGVAMLSLAEIPYVSRDLLQQPNIQAVIYPNPVKNQTHISIQLSKQESLSISLWNIQGEKLMDFMKNQLTPSGKQNFTLDLSTLIPQTYWIIIESAQDKKIIPIIKL